MVYVGYYESERTAAMAYDRVAYGLLGDRARLNFPKKIKTRNRRKRV